MLHLAKTKQTLNIFLVPFFIRQINDQKVTNILCDLMAIWLCRSKTEDIEQNDY